MRWLVPGPALDLGCGAGQVALHLQGPGCEVVGIDVSPRAVEVCRRRACRTRGFCRSPGSAGGWAPSTTCC